MTEDTELALRVLKSLGMDRTWPLIKATEEAIRDEANFLGCPIAQAACSFADAVRDRGHGRWVDVIAQHREERAGRVQRG